MLKLVKAYNLGYLITYLTIRCKVYIGEHRRKISEEFSIIDIKGNHYIFMQKGKIIGLVRVLYYQDRVAELGRVTIVKEYRNRGYGAAMMNQIITKIYDSRKAEVVRLFIAHESLANFYRKFGFTEDGEAYFDNVSYIRMIKIL